MSQPTEVEITESTKVRTDGKTIAALLALAIAILGSWMSLRMDVADARSRIQTLEGAKTKTDAFVIEQAVINQRVADSLEHIQETTGQTAKDVKDLLRRGR